MYHYFVKLCKRTSNLNVVDPLYPLPQLIKILEDAPNTFNQHQKAGVVLGMLRVVRMRHYRLSRRVR